MKFKIGSRTQVMYGTAKITKDNYSKKDLKYNKQSRIVLKKNNQKSKKILYKTQKQYGGSKDILNNFFKEFEKIKIEENIKINIFQFKKLQNIITNLSNNKKKEYKKTAKDKKNKLKQKNKPIFLTLEFIELLINGLLMISDKYNKILNLSPSSNIINDINKIKKKLFIIIKFIHNLLNNIRSNYDNLNFKKNFLYNILIFSDLIKNDDEKTFKDIYKISNDLENKIEFLENMKYNILNFFVRCKSFYKQIIEDLNKKLNKNNINKNDIEKYLIQFNKMINIYLFYLKYMNIKMKEHNNVYQYLYNEDISFINRYNMFINKKIEKELENFYNDYQITNRLEKDDTLRKICE